MTAPRDVLEGGPVRLSEDNRSPTKPRPAVNPAHVIGIGELAAVLGISRVTIIRWIDAGRIPKPERAPGDPAGTWRRWPMATAIQIVKNAGAKVPETWEKT